LDGREGQKEFQWLCQDHFYKEKDSSAFMILILLSSGGCDLDPKAKCYGDLQLMDCLKERQFF
jgi:hypothetical protein